MAEDKEKEAELSKDEAAELENLLEDAGDGDVAAIGLKGKLQKIFGNKKLLIIIVAVVLVIITGISYFFLRGVEETVVTPIEEQIIEEEEVKEKEKVKVNTENIYKLAPFFLPLLDNGKETGQFIIVSANLLLSNSVLTRELDKVLPLMRKNIYNILSRKRPSEFRLKRSLTEETIKKEIITASNSLLLSGTGTIQDVFFARFMIK